MFLRVLALSSAGASEPNSETLWLYGVILSLMLFGFAAAALALYRNSDNRDERPVPPIPMAPGFDRELSTLDRSRELQWIEALMAAPAHGSEPSSTEGSGSN